MAAVYGVADQKTLNAIAQELHKDREVKRMPDGSIRTLDDAGFAVSFQVTVRRRIELPGETVNAPVRPPIGPPM